MINETIITIGSKNIVKGHAVLEVIADFSFLDDARIETFDVPSRISDQPKSLEEIIRGAKNRAKAAVDLCHFSGAAVKCHYGFGIESGIFAISSNAGWMDTCACVIYDYENKSFSYGLASGWEIREDIIEAVFQQNMNLDQASKAVGLTTEDRVGRKEGLSGLLSNGRLTRKEHTKEAIRNALIYLERTKKNKE